MTSADEALARLCDPVAEVSAHYLIAESGQVFALVDEEMRAWHAGAGEWAGITDVNSHSVGIELANPGNCPFADRQMQALEKLLPVVMARWQIPARNVIGHSDMAPSRKGDPGRRFDWQRLALQGLSVWPAPSPAVPDRFAADLAAFGYPKSPPEHVLAAFRLRFRPGASGPLHPRDAEMAAGLARL
jgi:N-acetylmuramoyl-L-alanine amidase